MDKQRYIRKKLKEYHLNAKALNPHFSERALAKKIGMSSSTISEFQAGKRFLSLSFLKRIAQTIKIDGADLEHFESLPFKKKKDVFESTPNESIGEVFSSLEEERHFRNVFLDIHKEVLYFRGDLDVENKIKKLRNEFIEKASMICDNQDQQKTNAIYSVTVTFKQL